MDHFDLDSSELRHIEKKRWIYWNGNSLSTTISYFHHIHIIELRVSFNSTREEEEEEKKETENLTRVSCVLHRTLKKYKKKNAWLKKK